MKRRPWTAAEKAQLRELYPTHSRAQCALLLGRHVGAIDAQVKALRLTKHPRLPDDLVEEVRRLHGEGLADSEIGGRLDLQRRTVWDVRHRLGLPTHPEATLRCRRRAIASQRRSLGVRTAGELRALSHRRYAAENGWPEDLRPRAVQILNLLAAAGVPLTRRQIAEGIGMPWRGTRKSLTSNDPEGSYLAHLAVRGLVVILPRAHTVTGMGKGRSCHLYLLGPRALAILAKRAKEESCAQTTA